MGVESDKLVIEWRVTSKVRPYKGNPRTITEKAIEKVTASIRSFGWRQPIVVDQKGVIIAGHVRLLAAKKLGHKKVPVHVADMDETAANTYRLADNRSGEETRWNWPELSDALLGLDAALDVDLGITGFEPSELERMLQPAVATLNQFAEVEAPQQDEAWCPSEPKAVHPRPVTTEDVATTEKRLADHHAGVIAARAASQITVTCPFCAKDFAFSGA